MNTLEKAAPILLLALFLMAAHWADLGEVIDGNSDLTGNTRVGNGFFAVNADQLYHACEFLKTICFFALLLLYYKTRNEKC